MDSCHMTGEFSDPTSPNGRTTSTPYTWPPLTEGATDQVGLDVMLVKIRLAATGSDGTVRRIKST